MTFMDWLHSVVAVVAFVDLTRFAMAMWRFHARGNPEWKRFHHAYIGVLLVALPALGGWWALLSVLFWALGSDLIHDDADQHERQLDMDPSYQGAWHRRYARFLGWLEKFRLGRWIVTQLKKVSLA